MAALPIPPSFIKALETQTNVPELNFGTFPCDIAAESAQKPQTFVLAGSDDWEQLFIDGVSVSEGHNLSPAAVLDALGVPYRTIWYMEGEVESGSAHPKTLTEGDINGHLVAGSDPVGNAVPETKWQEKKP